MEPVTTTPENALQISELPADQQPFLEEAIENGEYRECPYDEIENKDALRELAGTVAERRERPEYWTVYLEYQGKYYTIRNFLIQDQAYG